MTLDDLKNTLEARQVAVYFVAVALGGGAALTLSGTSSWESIITPALALMLFATFLQVPLGDLGRAVRRLRFILTLVVANFVVVPALVFGLIQFLPDEPLVRIGVLLVLLTPCIDYVVTFAHIGKADARLLLATTPVLLLLQMILLPVYLGLFLGRDAAGLVHVGPFLHAFIWLIVVPLALAGGVQAVASRSLIASRIAAPLGVLPVPATAVVLFVVIAAVTPQLGLALDGVLKALPLYIAFAAIAPVLGWQIARLAKLDVFAQRAVAFSAATRNSLVVLPLALAVPNAVPILPAVIVAQTLVELVASLAYMRLAPSLR